MVTRWWHSTYRLLSVQVTTLSTYFYFSPTKACIVASVIFVLDKKTDLISAPHALVYFGIVIFFVYFKVSSKQLFNTLICAKVLESSGLAVSTADFFPHAFHTNQLL
jgi:hypothetical protein